MTTMVANAMAIELSSNVSSERLLELEGVDKFNRTRVSKFSSTGPSLPPMSDSMHPNSAIIASTIPIFQRNPFRAMNKNRKRYSTLQLSLKIPDTVAFIRKKPRTRIQVSAAIEPVTALNMINDDASDTSSICHSPSWSDHGGGTEKKKKKKYNKKEGLSRNKEGKDAETEQHEKQHDLKKEKEKTDQIQQKAKAMKSNRLVKISLGSTQPTMGGSQCTFAFQSESQILADTEAKQIMESMSISSPLSTEHTHIRQASCFDNEVFVEGIMLKPASNTKYQNHVSRKSLDYSDSEHESDIGAEAQFLVASNVQLKTIESKTTASIQRQSLGVRHNSSPATEFSRGTTWPVIATSHKEPSYEVRNAEMPDLIDDVTHENLKGRLSQGDWRHKTHRFALAGSHGPDMRVSPTEVSRYAKIRAPVESNIASVESNSQELQGSRDQSLHRASFEPRNSIEYSRKQVARTHASSRKENGLYSRSGVYQLPGNVHPSYNIHHLHPSLNEKQAKFQVEANAVADDDEVDQWHAFPLELAALKAKNRSRHTVADRNSSWSTASSEPASSPELYSFKSVGRAPLSRRSTEPTSSASSIDESKHRSGTCPPVLKPPKAPVSFMTPYKARPLFHRRLGCDLEQSVETAVAPNFVSSRPSEKLAVYGSPSSSSSPDRSDDINGVSVDDSSITNSTVSYLQSCQSPGVNCTHLERQMSQVYSPYSAEAQCGQTPPDDLCKHQLEGVSSRVPIATEIGNDFDQRTHQAIPYRSHSTPLTNNDLTFSPELKHQAVGGPQAKPAIKRSVTIDAVPMQATIAAPSVTKKTRGSILKPSSAPQSQVASRAESPNAYNSEISGSARISDPRVAQLIRAETLSRSYSSMKEDNTISTQTRESLAKMFVICCKCKFFQDLPSKIYETMVNPGNIIEDHDLGVKGHVTTMVRCPWCAHGMSTQCCAGYAAIVVLHERFH